MKQSSLYSGPANKVGGTINVPGDKSISHRSLILGSIAQGETQIKGFLEGEDCLATLHALRSMGVIIEGPFNQEVLIHGVGKYGLKKPALPLDCGNSGTSMRLLAGLLAAQTFDSCLTGDASLVTRPMERISQPLSQMGAQIQTSDGKAPLKIFGGFPLSGIHYAMPVASAQVKSCLLLAGMYAQGPTTLIEPALTRNHTENMLKSFSYPIDCQDNQITITSGHECQGTAIQIPGDISSAAFFMVAASILPHAELLIKAVGINPTRTGIITILKKMGADIRILNSRYNGGELTADLLVRSAPLHGINIPEELVPLAIDEFPIIFIAAACAQGETRLRGAKELRSKESDRIEVMVQGLVQLGIEAYSLEDGARIIGGTMQGASIDSHHDHRIAMAFAIAGACSTQGVTIHNCQTIATSFPQFMETANSIHLAIKGL